MFPISLRGPVSRAARSSTKGRHPAGRAKSVRLRPGLECLEARELLATTTWTGGVSSLWSDPGNWSVGVPGAGDTAVFTRTGGSHTATVDTAFALAALTIDGSWGGTIHVDSALSISDGLTLASGTFGGNSGITIAGTSLWTGGTIDTGAAGLSNAGTLTLDGADNKFLSGTLNNAGTIANAGTGYLFSPAR